MTKEITTQQPSFRDQPGSDVAQYSARIDEIDRRLIDLLRDRFQYSRHIGLLKARLGVELFDPVRVHSQKTTFIRSCARCGLDEGMAKSLIDAILDQVISERMAQESTETPVSDKHEP